VTTDSCLEVDSRGAVTWLRMNRPERMNAYDERMLEALLEAIASTPRDSVLVITGTGRAFCAGGYLANLANAQEADLRRLFRGSL
jgi:2-ketocyclohexanecarboxyl-CoA hydrolase